MEKYNKLSILGFYGALPDVTIHLKDWGRALERLMFLLSIQGGSGNYNIGASIFNPDGTLLSEGPKAEISLDPKPKVSFAGLIFVGLTFQQRGRHTFQLLLNGKETFKSEFIVDVGDPELFT
ncbi:MAG TPA: hypothetical protein VGP08_15155 [Pyrinomonadaceae bacterium]|nr:hypothetical protein [Pyrinomonadaceae bacterium]